MRMGYLICLVIVLTLGANLAAAQYSYSQGCPSNCAAVFCAAIDPNVCFERYKGISVQSDQCCHCCPICYVHTEPKQNCTSPEFGVTMVCKERSCDTLAPSTQYEASFHNIRSPRVFALVSFNTDDKGSKRQGMLAKLYLKLGRKDLELDFEECGVWGDKDAGGDLKNDEITVHILKMFEEFVLSLTGTNASVEREFSLINNFWGAEKSPMMWSVLSPSNTPCFLLVCLLPEHPSLRVLAVSLIHSHNTFTEPITIPMGLSSITARLTKSAERKTAPATLGWKTIDLEGSRYVLVASKSEERSHSGLNGVKIHGKGKKHLELTSALLQVSLEENLNRIAQKGQLDIIVRYWDSSLNVVSTQYLNSVFLGHSTAADLDSVTSDVSFWELQTSLITKEGFTGEHPVQDLGGVASITDCHLQEYGTPCSIVFVCPRRSPVCEERGSWTCTKRLVVRTRDAGIAVQDTSTRSPLGNSGWTVSQRRNKKGRKAKIIALAKASAKGISDKDIQKEIPDLRPDQRAVVINKLLVQGYFDLFNQGGTLLYKLKDPALHTDKIKGADNEEKIVYSIIEEAGSKGIWIRDIRYKSNLVPTQLNKILKILENKKLIKAVKSVAASKKKVYMLFNLEPDRSVTGGAWYCDQDFEAEFVDVLNQQCYRYLQQKSENIKDCKGGPIAARNISYASSKDVWKFISELGISKVQLSVEDIETILDTLLYDGKVERSVALDGSYLYRAIESLLDAPGIVRMPCGVCPL
uniref:DNA-directed RNA polymerase III subunit RPC6 n=1 Tax=Timema shepardi TaxID=629360 RepID=A0A7R9ANK0_TIMSH|nr:unnamed protein product [Timema shepardi]